MPEPRRLLLHLVDGSRRAVEPDDVYYLEAEEDDTLVRLRGRRLLRDVRRLREIEAAFARFGFVRIHRSWVVNPAHVRKLRPRKSLDWEVALDPPVNRVLPVSRQRLKALLRAFGDG